MSLRQLQNATGKTIKRSKSKNPPKGMKTDAKIVGIYDGDTCDLAYRQNKKLRRKKCRLASINAPEMRKKPVEAKKSRDFLGWLCTGGRKTPSRFPHTSPPWTSKRLQSRLDKNRSLVHAEFHGDGKYRRPIVTIKKTKQGKKSFNKYLLENGYAKPYRKRRK